MRPLIVALLYAAILAQVSVAQTPPVPQAPSPAPESIDALAPKRVTYFLIDASGSMESRIEDAESKVQKKLNEIIKADGTALVSRTYFRAVDRHSCWAKIPIEGKVVATDSKRKAVRFNENDFTPLGAALEAAILDADDQPADIFLVTDDEQSPGCGIDICEVAAVLLPGRANIDVRTMSIAPMRAEHDRVGGCIEGAQGKPLPVPVVASAVPKGDAAETAKDDKSEDEAQHDIGWWVARFFERWFWLIGFVLVAGSSALAGRRDSQHAIVLEIKTQEARSHRDSIRQGIKAAEGELVTLVGATKTYIENSKTPAWGIRAMFGFGSMMLVLLALLPNEIQGFQIAGAKEAANQVLNTDFATAFAGTWLAVIYFASSQSQRRSEAEHNFYVVTDEAQSIAEAQKTAAYKEYESRFESLGGFTFDPPALAETEVIDDETPVPDHTKFRLIVAEAISLGERAKLPTSADQQAIRDETTRLARLLRPRLFERSFDFGAFIENLIKDKSIKEDVEEWGNLAVAFRLRSPKFWDIVDRLAGRLTKAAGR